MTTKLVIDEKAIGKRIRSRRLKHGLSQNGLASASGLPQSNLSAYEQGRALPSIQTLATLAEALDTSVAYLLGEKKSPS